MNHILSTLANYVPGLLRPSVIQALYTAHSTLFGTKSKIEQYCDATKRLYDQGCIYSAQLPLYLAGRVVHIKIPNDSFSTTDEIECLCKISQVRNLLSPAIVPPELNEAVDLASQVTDGEKNTHYFVWSRAYLEMGKAYIAASDQLTASVCLLSARGFAKRGRPLESVDALCKIAQAEKQIDIEEAKITLQAARENTSGMFPQSIAKVGRLVTISDLYFSFDPGKAAEVCALAQAEINKMDEGSERVDSQKLVDGALSSLNNRKNS